VRIASALGVGLAGAGGSAGLYVGAVTGALTLDLGIGRRTRPLGPMTVTVQAPRQRVFDVAAAPYAERQTRAMSEKVQILERAEGMVLAAHRTPVGGGLTAVTVETVALTPPDEIRFRLLRGPVPQVEETFAFEGSGDDTVLTYTGVLGTDLWALGQQWGDLVARNWENTVRASLDQIKAEAERGS
jgi:hypothetical protein